LYWLTVLLLLHREGTEEKGKRKKKKTKKKFSLPVDYMPKGDRGKKGKSQEGRFFS